MKRNDSRLLCMGTTCFAKLTWFDQTMDDGGEVTGTVWQGGSSWTVEEMSNRYSTQGWDSQFVSNTYVVYSPKAAELHYDLAGRRDHGDIWAIRGWQDRRLSGSVGRHS